VPIRPQRLSQVQPQRPQSAGSSSSFQPTRCFFHTLSCSSSSSSLLRSKTLMTTLCSRTSRSQPRSLTLCHKHLTGQIWGTFRNATVASSQFFGPVSAGGRLRTDVHLSLNLTVHVLCFMRWQGSRHHGCRQTLKTLKPVSVAKKVKWREGGKHIGSQAICQTIQGS
jgi:hypothetical protein